MYSAKIVGNWLGTLGNMKESITLSADGSFIALLRPQGFISNTLSQGVTGTAAACGLALGVFINGNTPEKNQYQCRGEREKIE